MTAFARRSVEFLVALLAVASLVVSAAPATAQIAPPGSGPLACDPENPEPGGETECTAEGLEAGSAFTWTAEFADATTASGDGSADADGVGVFTVEVPDAEGEYTVTVSGTADDGEPYEETFTGEVGGEGGLPLPLPGGSEDPTEEPTEGGSESEEPGGGGDGAPPAGDESQVDPVPSGGVATGMGGTADDGRGDLAVLAALLALGAATGVAVRRRRSDH